MVLILLLMRVEAMRKVKLLYEVEYTIEEKGGMLVIEEVYRRDGKVVKVSSYLYTPNAVVSVTDGRKTYKMLVKDRVSFAYVVEVARHIDHPEIPEGKRLLFLQRYSHPHYFNSRTGRVTLRRLLNLLNLSDEINQQEVSKNEERAEPSAVNTS